MIVTINSAAINGLEAIKIKVEVNLSRGNPQLIIIGLASKSIEESKERITAALINSGIRPKSQRTIVNLAPADIHKNGSNFDLAIVVGLLKLYKKTNIDTEQSMFFGELSLSGDIKKIKGVLPLIIAAKEMGIKNVYIPEDNGDEVSIISGINIYPIKNLNQLINKSSSDLVPIKTKSYSEIQNNLDQKHEINIEDIVGQKLAKRSLEIAAAGGHNILMVGPPGVGKSMLAKALLSILPTLNKAEAIETTKIYSIAGQNNNRIISQRPFRSPHHTITTSGMLGGGSVIKPGEISFAHNGVLFLDEFAEYSKNVIDSLRQPMENKQVSISRTTGCLSFPANFTLIAASNPCPCGYKNSFIKECSCNNFMLENYRKRISGPILDRIDMIINVEATEIKLLNKKNLSLNYDSETTKKRVEQARRRQRERFINNNLEQKLMTNSQMNSKQIKKLCKISKDAQKILSLSNRKIFNSTRSYFKTIKIAQTIADLNLKNEIGAEEMIEAINYRRTSFW